MELIPLKNIKSLPLPDDQYYKTVTAKKQIVLHHTASGPGVEGDVNWWKSTPDHVATAFIIARDGTIYQLFDPRYWAHHLGLKTANNGELNKGSIGIELDSWGWLKDGKSYTGTKVAAPITNYPDGYRGQKQYESYTPAQITALKDLLKYLGSAFDIPLGYKGDIMFGVSQKALAGHPGIWSHSSYRSDKFDVHPQPELIKMLSEL